jgi:hypothetical protein
MKPYAVLLLASAAFVHAGAAAAQSAGNMLAEYGVLGRWAADCSRGPGAGNAHTIFERAQNASGAQYRVIFAPGQSTTRSVDRVRAVADNLIAMRFTTQSGDTAGLAFDITMQKEPKRYRVVESKGSDGKTYIKDGIVVASGQPNPWQNHCGAE